MNERASCIQLVVIPVLLLKAVHLAAMAIWFGASIAMPADVHRTLRLGAPHTSLLLQRLRTTARLMNGAGHVTLASGIGLVMLMGGFAALPMRFHVALVLTLLVFVVGRWLIRPAVGAIAAVGDEWTEEQADVLSRRFSRALTVEHVLRVAVLLLMVFPLSP